MVVNRVGMLSLGKVLGVLYALLGLIVGALFAIVSLLGAAVGAANSQTSDAFAGLLFGVGAVIFLPIFYGILGFVVGLIGALLYNGMPHLIGGRDRAQGDQARKLQLLFMNLGAATDLDREKAADSYSAKWQLAVLKSMYGDDPRRGISEGSPRTGGDDNLPAQKGRCLQPGGR